MFAAQRRQERDKLSRLDVVELNNSTVHNWLHLQILAQWKAFLKNDSEHKYTSRDWGSAQTFRRSDKHRQTLSNEYLVAKIDFNTAESEPQKPLRCVLSMLNKRACLK